MSAIAHQAAIGLTQNDTTILVASLIALVVILTTFGASRIWPTRRPVASPEQAAYLMDQLVTEKETARQLRTELDATKVEVTTLRSEVSQLRTENASLRTQMEYVLSLMRGQAAAQSSATAATHPPQNGARARASFAMTDGDLSLRDWIVEHFDDGDLAVLAANAGMERPVPAKLAEMVTALVMAARRNGNLERLEREALEMRPDVEAPDASRH